MHIGARLRIRPGLVCHRRIERHINDHVSVTPFIALHLGDELFADIFLAEEIDDELARVDIRRDHALGRENYVLAARQAHARCHWFPDHLLMRAATDKH